MDCTPFLIFALCVFPFAVSASNVGAETTPGVTSLPSIRNCSDMQSVTQALRECFIREELPYVSPLGDGSFTDESLLKVFISNNNALKELCRDVSRYQRATVCAMEAVRPCEPLNALNYLPSNDNVRKGLAMQCDKIKDVNIGCVSFVASKIMDCDFSERNNFTDDELFNSSTKDIMCHSSAVLLECLDKVLPSCGCPTTKAYMEYYTINHNTLLGCSSFPVKSPECVIPFAVSASNVGAETTPEVTSLPSVQDCSDIQSVTQAQQECFTREELPFVSSTGERNFTEENSVKVFISNNNVLQALCRDVSRYQRATVCAMEVERSCATLNVLHSLPSKDNVRKGLAMQCDKLKDINVGCVNSVGSRIMDCHFSERNNFTDDELFPSSTKDLMCHSSAVLLECLAKVLPSCGCPTTKAYIEYYTINHNTLLGCSSFPVKSPECEQETERVVDGGATMLKRTLEKEASLEQRAGVAVQVTSRLLSLLVWSGLVLCVLHGAG